jgi:anti-sigma regulatory factor (Ser/Thr protein kinase)
LLDAAAESEHARAITPPHTRIAIPGEDAAYSVLDVEEASFSGFVARTIDIVATTLNADGKAVPEIALREVLENLVHAVPCSASIVLGPALDSIFISDTGPGISRPDLAFELGYSTASELQRSYIRGVGIGLYLAREDILSFGGELRIESGAGQGTCVLISLSSPSHLPPYAEGVGGLSLTQRQNNILFLLSEGESLGPSRISDELNIGVSTAHRDLVKLQEVGLICSNVNGKRFLSDMGRSYLQSLLSL